MKATNKRTYFWSAVAFAGSAEVSHGSGTLDALDIRKFSSKDLEQAILEQFKAKGSVGDHVVVYCLTEI